MSLPQKYASASAFRVALEVRLKRLAQEERLDLQRVRRQATFDRLLCRLFDRFDSPWLLKGGYAMELRLKAARTTRDIDLALKQLPVPSTDWDANADAVLEALRDAGQRDLKDFFTFVFGNAIQDLVAAPYGGARFPVEARPAGRSFVKFHLDVSVGDGLGKPFESLSGRDWLGFAGIAGAKPTAISPEEQFAEKLHAYTLPRLGRENTCVKDLVDLVLLSKLIKLDITRLPKAIHETFQRRKTHGIPAALDSPPASWSTPFATMAAECGLAADMEQNFGMLNQFFSKLGL